MGVGGSEEPRNQIYTVSTKGHLTAGPRYRSKRLKGSRDEMDNH